ncbi:hypothetical protein DFQ27_003498 [Actinomortierella ambigua]|uniref:Uncharacterized protein n=1 Tax=Actinomortierella ambigua TaxID=1343610 RepID=A0A9P6Q4M7_9FUNG|nr:hypothetical protein DFQ26_000621 [Actinomortierella ambigua]KAG0260516.1 hypothetical protein DFQ27_003498 [Actinomortierella ambigua]
MAPSPVLDRVESRGPRSRFYTMHQHRHPYGADYRPQAQHSHRQNGHRIHPQQFNLENDDDDDDDSRSVVSEQLSEILCVPAPSIWLCPAPARAFLCIQE